MHNITARSWTSLSMHRTNRSWTWRYCPLSNCFFIGLMLLGYKFRLFQSLYNSSIYVNNLIIEMTTQLTSKINGRFCFPRHFKCFFPSLFSYFWWPETKPTSVSVIFLKEMVRIPEDNDNCSYFATRGKCRCNFSKASDVLITNFLRIEHEM